MTNLQPPEGDTAVRLELIGRLQQLVHTINASATLHPFGSSVSGLHSRGADLDLTLVTDGAEMAKEVRRAGGTEEGAWKRSELLLPPPPLPAAAAASRAATCLTNRCIRDTGAAGADRAASRASRGFWADVGGPRSPQGTRPDRGAAGQGHRPQVRHVSATRRTRAPSLRACCHATRFAIATRCRRKSP